MICFCRRSFVNSNLKTFKQNSCLKKVDGHIILQEFLSRFLSEKHSTSPIDQLLVNCEKYLTFSYFQVLMKTCPELSVLILSPNKTIDDQSAAVLSGVQELVVKGPLKKTISVNNPTKNHRLRLLDISNTSITINGRALLKKCLPNCSIITSWQIQSVTWPRRNNLLKRHKFQKTHKLSRSNKGQPILVDFKKNRLLGPCELYSILD